MKPLKHTVFHVDANSAYLSWEAVHRLQRGDVVDLRNIPAVVGGDEASRHGIVLAKSAMAKKKGIQTGETLYQARQKCPGLVVVPPNYHLYMQASGAMIQIMRQHSPVVQQYSIDEAFLSMYFPKENNSEAIDCAHDLKRRIREELGFTVNVGIGPNKVLAKMASEFEKPDRVHTLFHDEIQEKLWPLPIEELFFVGRATARKLRGYGITTIGALARLNPGLVRGWLKKPGLLIWHYANGIDHSAVTEQGVPIKSIGNSSTIPFDVADIKTAKEVLLSLTETAGMRLRNLDRCARTVSISYRNFELLSHQRQCALDTPTDSTRLIWKTACRLLEKNWRGEPLRQFGVHVSELYSNDLYQLSVFDHDTQKETTLDKTIDSLRSRFGPTAVFRGCFANSPMRPLMGGVINDQEEKYPMMSSHL